jgi:hypothetical protein
MFFFCLQGVNLIGPSQYFLKHWALPQNKKCRDTCFPMTQLYRLWKFTFDKNYGIKHSAIRNILGNLWENSLRTCGEHNENTKIQKHWTHTSYMVPPPPSILCFEEEAHLGFYARERPMFQKYRRWANDMTLFDKWNYRHNPSLIEARISTPSL